MCLLNGQREISCCSPLCLWPKLSVKANKVWQQVLYLFAINRENRTAYMAQGLANASRAIWLPLWPKRKPVVLTSKVIHLQCLIFYTMQLWTLATKFLLEIIKIFDALAKYVYLTCRMCRRYWHGSGVSLLGRRTICVTQFRFLPKLRIKRATTNYQTRFRLRIFD